jgi:hypothetical protein
MADVPRLDSRERETLARDGYVLREAVFDAADLRSMRDACEALVQRLLEERRRTKHAAGAYLFELQRRLETMVKWEPDAPGVVQGVELFAHLSEALHSWALDPRFVEPIKDVVGAEVVGLFTEKLNLKRGRDGGPIVLHQDYPYWIDASDDPARIGTAMLFLDDANRENGCLEVAPGSHREGERPRQAVEGFGQFEMDPGRFDLRRLVALEVPAGSVVYFGPFLVHRSLPNRSGADRRALLYSYQPAGRERMRDRLWRSLRRPAEPAPAGG